MPNRAPAIISSALTILMLILFAILSIVTQMLVLNGASERQGMTVMSISLACQGTGIILAGTLAGWLTNLVIARYDWNKILAVVTAVFAGTLLGGAIAFLSIFISISLAGIR